MLRFHQRPIPDASKQFSTLVCVNSEEDSAIALKFACLRAKRRNQQLAILHVIEPTEFQGLSSITDAIREEREEAAQQLLLKMQEIAARYEVEHPTLIVEEDTLWNGITTAIRKDPNITMIILAIRPDSIRGPKLMAALTEELGNNINVPIMVVPGNLRDIDIDLLS